MNVAALLTLAAGITHAGQRVNQRQHALRCATEAQLGGAGPELVAVALIHDLAKPLDEARFARWDHAALRPGPIDPAVVDVAVAVLGG